HPGLILISKKLTGSENYSSWKRSIMIALNAKNKMKFVTIAFLEPSMESELRPIWERNNDMLISWIFNTNCSVEVYYHKLKGFYDALEALYMCICACNCNNRRINGEKDQRKRLIRFLMGLDKGYSNIRGQILLMQPLPSAAKAYTMVRQEEKQMETSNPKHQTSTILNSYTNQSRLSTNNSQKCEKVRKFFKRFDFDGDGGLNRKEMASYLAVVNLKDQLSEKKMTSNVKNMFGVTGLSCDGLIKNYENGEDNLDAHFKLLKLR
nr:UBN2_3 domain-containing protein [Tanacetum cinerariifolium]